MGAFGPVYRREFEKRGKPVTVSVSGPPIVNDADFLTALDAVGLALSLEDYVAGHIARGALVCPPSRGSGGRSRAWPVRPRPPAG
jgi:hypothetical protein